jgi:3-(3-hydroxy-phenyl)propionate hydroxylase
MTAPEEFDVAIVGFGPTGSTLCALLAKRGLRVAAFDKYSEIYPKPRAIGLDHEAMRVFQQAGIADAVKASSITYPPTVYLGVDGTPIQRIEMTPTPYPLSWPPNSTFDQPALESALRRNVAEFQNIVLFFDHEVLECCNARDRVQLLAHAKDSSMRSFAAKYVVACDGAQSRIRGQASIAMEDLAFEESWIVVDLLVTEKSLESLPQTNIQYCDPKRPSTFVICPGRHRRWEFKMLPTESFSDDIPSKFLQSLLAPWLTSDQFEIRRAAAYQFRARVAERWRNHRILLAGDAAHQMPPFLGQGMCQGVRDAANLEWKLANVIQGSASDRILDTYEAERRPHVLQVTKVVKVLGTIIGEQDPQRARARDDRLLAEQGGQVKAKIRQSLIPGIAGGTLLADSKATGQVFPQPLVSIDGIFVRLDDLTGSCVRVVCAAEPDPTLRTALSRLLRKSNGMLIIIQSTQTPLSDGVCLIEKDGVLANWFAGNDCVAAVVRPDHYVYGTVQQLNDVYSLLQSFLSSLHGTEGTHGERRETQII